MKLSEFDQELDEKAGTGPKKKTPEELLQNPLDLLEPEQQTMHEQQKKLDDTWQVAQNGEPKHGHDWSINDNDSKNGPAR